MYVYIYNIYIYIQILYILNWYNIWLLTIYIYNYKYKGIPPQKKSTHADWVHFVEFVILDTHRNALPVESVTTQETVHEKRRPHEKYIKHCRIGYTIYPPSHPALYILYRLLVWCCDPWWYKFPLLFWWDEDSTSWQSEPAPSLLHHHSMTNKKTGGLLSTRPMASILPRCCVEILLLPNRDKVAGIHGENDVKRRWNVPQEIVGTPTCMAKDLQLKLGGFGVGWWVWSWLAIIFFNLAWIWASSPCKKLFFSIKESLDDIPCWNFWIYALVPEHGNGESPLHNRTQ